MLGASVDRLGRAVGRAVQWQRGYQTLLLLVGEQPCAGVQGPAGVISGVGGLATAVEKVLLDKASVLIKCVCGQIDNMEGVHRGCGVSCPPPAGQ